ncbi:Beta-lactamase [Sulfitobacter noctilucae]|uniref:serine hydrolase domain-containing protein n=1 Tax=Sulfitobacter noctilucae TaxID=1342302 RepID=UPI0004691073|nr:serine hydrolase domain-containing protein [Sulfitobacter noctilucae]KIN60362.1 Beta-lactamase [Sulfitobacter noctilucae]
MRSYILMLCLMLAGYAINAYRGSPVTMQIAPSGQSDADKTAQTISDLVPGSVGKPAGGMEVTESVVPALPQTPFEFDLAGAEQVWRNWMAEYNLTAGAMSLGRHGQILQSANLRRSPDTPYPVASLSKAITAMCLNKMLAETEYGWTSTLGDLASVLARLNMPPQAGVRSITLAALANHTTGFTKNLKGMDTAGEGRNLYTQQNIAREALTNPAHLPKKGKFFYSNVNYAILGQVIVALSGQSYEETCQPLVMAPAGALGAIVGGRMWATAGFGGWSVSSEDYARFVMHWYAPERDWVATPEDFAYYERRKSGLGVFQTPQRTGGYLIHHTGLWESKKASRQHGALFVTSDTGATFVANWQGDLDKKAYSDLRKAIAPYLQRVPATN